MIAPVSRIVARYLSGALMAYGILPAGEIAAIEPEVALAVGAILGVLTEAVYAFAVRKGWTT